MIADCIRLIDAFNCTAGCDVSVNADAPVDRAISRLLVAVDGKIEAKVSIIFVLNEYELLLLTWQLPVSYFQKLIRVISEQVTNSIQFSDIL